MCTLRKRALDFQRQMDPKGHWTHLHLQHRGILMHVSIDFDPACQLGVCMSRTLNLNAGETHFSTAELKHFSCVFCVDIRCERASRLLGGASSVTGVSRRVGDARKRSFVCFPLSPGGRRTSLV